MPRAKEFDYEQKLTEARNLFWEKGYHATSLQNIMDTMRLNKSSIYDSFGGKHELFVKCLLDYASFKLRQYEQAGRKEASAFKALEKTIKDVVDQTLKDNRSCLIVKSIFELAPTDNEVREIITEKGAALENILFQLLVKAKEQGEIRNNIQPRIAARYILHTFSSFWSHYILSQNKKEVNEMVRFLINSLKV